MKLVRLSALGNGHLYPQEIFLVLVSLRGWVDPQGHNTAGRIMSIKNSNDTIGNRTRDLLIKTFQFRGITNQSTECRSLSASAGFVILFRKFGLHTSPGSSVSSCTFFHIWTDEGIWELCHLQSTLSPMQESFSICVYSDGSKDFFMSLMYFNP